MPASKRVRVAGNARTKVLFPKPHGFVVEGKDHTPTMTQVETVDSSATDGYFGTNVRLKSSKVNIVNRRNCPKWVTYRCSTQPLQNEIFRYLENAEIGGFDVGAIVARRWGIHANWKQPQLWGMIMMVRNTYINNREPWAPFLVKWINSGLAEPAWAEDLLCIVPSMSDALVQELVEAQAVDTTDNGSTLDDDELPEHWSNMGID